MNFNKVLIAGRLARDPETRYTPKGTALAKLTLGINRKYTVEGQSKDETCFVDIDVWGKQAETIAQYCKKGSSLLVEGRLKLDQWEDKQSHQKRSKLGVVLESFQFVGDKNMADAPATSPQSASRAIGASSTPEDSGDLVPF